MLTASCYSRGAVYFHSKDLSDWQSLIIKDPHWLWEQRASVCHSCHRWLLPLLLLQMCPQNLLRCPTGISKPMVQSWTHLPLPCSIPLFSLFPISVNDTTICSAAQARNLGLSLTLSATPSDQTQVLLTLTPKLLSEHIHVLAHSCSSSHSIPLFSCL